jgi:alpha-glucosidase
MRTATLDHPPRFHLAAKEDARITLASDTGATAHVFVLEEDVLRLMVLPTGQLTQPRSWTVAPGAEDVALEGRDRFDLGGFTCPPFILDLSEPGYLRVETRQVRLLIGLRGLACRWEMRLGGAWVEAMRDRPTQAYDFGWWDGAVRHYLSREPGEQYFGLGERAGPMDRAGRRFRLSNMDALGYDARTSDPLYKHIPFYITRRPGSGSSVAGLCFGLFYDTLSDCVFDFGCEHSNYHGPYRSFQAAHGDLDLYVLAGPGVAEVTRRFTWLTGRPAETPSWALGYSGSTMGYTDAPDAEARMAGFRAETARHTIPCASFHLSSGYTSIGARRYVFTWNRDKFPDPEAFIAAFAAAGIRLIANIKPVLLLDHPAFAEAAAAGLLLADQDGAPVLEQFWDAPGAFLDFTNPDTVAWWKRQVTMQLLEKGIAATWNDNNEFEITNPRALAHGFGQPYPAHEMKPLQTLLMLRASREAQAEHAPDRPPFLVSRAGAAGMQRYAQTWSGDNATSWETLRWNIPMGLGLALSGISNTGHDVGGFAGPRPEPELFLRWLGFGVFMPRFSIHSWNDDGSVNEPWMYPEVLPEVQALMALRTRLIPYIAACLARYRDTYEPAIRPLFYDFPEDPEAWSPTECFMLGNAVLVAPIVTPGVRTCSVYLPAGGVWQDGWTGDVLDGGISVLRPAPFAEPPFFIRQDAAVWMGQQPPLSGSGR